MIQDKNKTIYDLDLHESMRVEMKYNGSSWDVVRVASGWIYSYWNGNEYSHSIFVPFDNRFNTQDEKEI